MQKNKKIAFSEIEFFFQNAKNLKNLLFFFAFCILKVRVEML